MPDGIKHAKDFASLKVDETGKVTSVDKNGVIREHTLDGKVRASVEGDAREKLDLHQEKEQFAQVLAKVEDPITQMHIKEGVFELEQRL
jgi:hypothetical protein